MVGVLHVAMALEDPFDNQGLDGIYVDEALFEAEQVLVSEPPTVLRQLRLSFNLPCHLSAACGTSKNGSLQLPFLFCHKILS